MSATKLAKFAENLEQIQSQVTQCERLSKDLYIDISEEFNEISDAVAAMAALLSEARIKVLEKTLEKYESVLLNPRLDMKTADGLKMELKCQILMLKDSVPHSY